MQDQCTTKHRPNLSHLTTKMCVSGSDTTDGISRAKCTRKQTNKHINAAEMNMQSKLYVHNEIPAWSIYMKLSC